MFFPILGDPGAVSGGGKKSKRARKNSGEEKSRTRTSFKLSGLCHVIVFLGYTHKPHHQGAEMDTGNIVVLALLLFMITFQPKFRKLQFK